MIIHPLARAQSDSSHFNRLRPERIRCQFYCEKIVKSDLTRNSVPVRDCKLYAFRKIRGTLTCENPTAPADIQSTGLCDYRFLMGETYYLYFAGRTLSTSDISGLESSRKDVLIEQIIRGSKSHIHDNNAGLVNAILIRFQHSFFWWIALLHHIEDIISDNDLVLTKVRKLYYNDSNWDKLIDRGSVSPLYSYDSNSGSITLNAGVHFRSVGVVKALRIIEAFGRTYEKKSSTQFKLDSDDDRTMTDRHEYVILPDRDQIHLGHTLTGMETYRFDPSAMGKRAFDDPHSAATWAGDLGQAAWGAVDKIWKQAEEIDKDESWNSTVSGVYEDMLTNHASDCWSHWEQAQDSKARRIEIRGDIHGIILGRQIDNGYGSQRLSQILEDYFCDPERDKEAITSFLSAYGVPLDTVRKSKTGESNVPSEFYTRVASFAETWDTPPGRTDFDDDRDVDKRVVEWAVHYFCDEIDEIALSAGL